MSDEPKGSKPGSIAAESRLARVNTLPTVEFTIPADLPEALSRCHSRQTPYSAAQASTKAKVNDGEKDVTFAEESNDTASHDVDPSYPEGGMGAWSVVLGSFFGTIVAFGMMNTIGIFHEYVSQHQLKDYSESTIGWIFSVYVFLSFFCGIQIGPIFDAHGPRLLILAGSILMSASMLLLGLCSQYWHFMIVFGILGGLGTSLIFTPALSAVSHFFLEKRGYATGIAAAGGSVGGIIFPLSLQRLFPAVGFAWATRIIGFVFIACCSVAITLIRSRLPPKPGQSVVPDLFILRDRAYLLLTIGIYLMEWALFIPITYLTTFAASSGAVTSAFAYQLLAIFNAGSCVGRWASGLTADKLGRFNGMIAALVVCTATTVTLWLPASILTANTSTEATTIKALTIVYAAIFGFASGSNISLTPVCVGQLCDTNQYGRYYATCYTIVSFGTLTGIPIAGSLISATGGRYWGAVIWTGICYILSLACFTWSRACKVGWNIAIKY